MKLAFLSMLLLIAQQFHLPGNFSVKYQGDIVAETSRSEFTSGVLGDPIIDPEAYDQFTEKLEKKIYKKPVNATINKKGEIISGENGYKLNRKHLKEQFSNYYYSSGSLQVEVPKLTLYPEVDRELLGNISTNKIGQYVTYFNTINKERSHNILLSTEAINNHVVFPGETFSFNEVVGKRTKEKGYLPAPVIVRGELSEGIGGGICQVSSTLYNAVDSAGLQIVKRYSHSKQVPYVPPGRDATVSWYGPDFAFKNEHNQPILIQAKINGGSVVIEIFSSDVIKNKTREAPDAPKELPKEIEIDLSTSS